VTPHVAAATNPVTGAKIVADNIRRLYAGQPLRDVVDPHQQY
jgi:glyoxylate/hydroxypyruvate reductase A